jgi:hypothetical protein
MTLPRNRTQALLGETEGSCFGIVTEAGGVVVALQTQAQVDAYSDARFERARQRAASLARVYPEVATELHLIIGDITIGLEYDAQEDDHRADALACAGRAKGLAQQIIGWIGVAFGVRGAVQAQATRQRMVS